MKHYEEIQQFTGKILTVVFVVLKLTNTVDWSWWWILLPILLFNIDL